MLRAGELVDGRFEVERAAAEGGTSAVYRACDRHTDRHVALKVLDSRADGEPLPGASIALKARLTREASILAALRHPNIVRYVAHGIVGGAGYLATERIDGPSLADRLREGPLAIAESVALARRVAEALREVHARGVVHRDVKPQNLILAGGDLGRITLLDFGIALSPNPTRLTASGWLVGSAAYLSPERALGVAEIDARSDVFSLGCLVFECLTGRRAHEGQSTTAVLARILWEETPRARDLRADVPAALDDLVARMIAKEPAARPADAAAVARELGALGELAPRGAPVRPALINARLQAMLSWPPPGDDDEPASSSEPTPAPPSAPVSDPESERSLTDDEQRTVWVVAAAPIQEEADARCAETVSAFAGRFFALADGCGVALFAEAGSPLDEATRAARCALALADTVPSAAVAIGAGRAVVSGPLPVGEAIDRAVGALSRARPGRLCVDDLTASLLSGRFQITTHDGGAHLGRETGAADARRTLLGRATPFVGREVELDMLESLLDECVTERVARAVLVSAGPGMGKSRLRYEFVRKRQAGADGARIWVGRGDAGRASSPWATIGEVVRDALSVDERDTVDARRAKLAAAVDALETPDPARLRAFLGELCGAAAPDEDGQVRSARRDARLMGDQLRRAVLDWLEAECARAPVVLVLEDLHWADSPSIACVDAALRQLADAPLMVLALARPEIHQRLEAPTSDRRARRLPGDGPLLGATEVRLRELSPRAGAALARAVLGERVAAETIAELVERADGNAFFLEELIRAVALAQGPALPATVIATVQARFDALDPRGRRLLRAASVLGRSFQARDVSALLGGGDAVDDVARWLEYLSDRELCTAQRRGDGAPAYVFRHALVREAAYASLTDADRALGHRLAGEWLAALERPEAAVVADHLARGGADAAAAGWYVRAAEQALEGNDFVAALAHADSAARCGLAPERAGEVALLESVAHGWRGEYALAQASAEAALAALGEGTGRWLAAIGQLGVTSGRLGDAAGLAAAAARVLACEVRDVPAMVVATGRIAMEVYFAGMVELAGTLCDRLEVVPEEALAGDPAAEAWALRAREIRAALASDPVTELRCLQLAAERFGRAGDLRNAALMRANIGYALTQLGAHAEAEIELRAALAAAERLNIATTQGLALQNLGLALAQIGNLDEARATEERAVEAFVAQGDARLEAGSRVYLAQIHLARGELEAARTEARRACELAAAPGLEAFARAVLARTLLAAGRLDEAIGEAERAAATLAELGTLGDGEALVRLAHAEALHAEGDAEAGPAIERARQRLLERARSIHDRARRETFLTGVPEHARTLALADAWRA